MNRDVETNHELYETCGSCLEPDSNKTNIKKKKKIRQARDTTEQMIGVIKNDSAFARGDITTGVMF